MQIEQRNPIDRAASSTPTSIARRENRIADRKEYFQETMPEIDTDMRLTDHVLQLREHLVRVSTFARQIDRTIDDRLTVVNDKQMKEMPEHLRPIEFDLFAQHHRYGIGQRLTVDQDFQPFDVDFCRRSVQRSFLRRETEGENLQRPFEILVGRQRNRSIASDEFSDEFNIGLGDIFRHGERNAARQRRMANDLPLDFTVIGRISIVHKHLKMTMRMAAATESARAH